jgi:DNA polymerase-3 subunit delta'
MAFKDITGNWGVKRILSKALKQKKLSNSLLFAGPEGIGKKETALVVAKALNCLKKSSDACEECTYCRAINNGNFPDVMVLSPAKEVLKIDQMRLLKDTAYLKPMTGHRRVFIVEEAEKMNDEASNSLLKVLEEPPAFSQIILITSNPYIIIQTIKSRCQLFMFSPIARDEIEKVLALKGYREDKARILSLHVSGNLKQALTLEWEKVQTLREQAWHLFLAFLKEEKISPHMKQFSSLRTAVKEELEDVFRILSSFCRDVILIKEGADRELLLNPDFEEDLLKIAGAITLEQALEILSRIDFAATGLKKNLNMNILLSAMFSKFFEWDHV